MRLYLLRHGTAIDRDDPDCPPDAQRFLTGKGATRCRQVCEVLRELGVRPQAMFASPLLRAVQTAEIAADVLGFPKARVKQTPTLLPAAAPEEFLGLLNKSKAEEVLAAGHAPNLDEVLAAAVGAPQQLTALKKAGVACVEWNEPGMGKGILLWLAAPKLLRAR